MQPDSASQQIIHIQITHISQTNSAIQKYFQPHFKGGLRDGLSWVSIHLVHANQPVFRHISSNIFDPLTVSRPSSTHSKSPPISSINIRRFSLIQSLHRPKEYQRKCRAQPYNNMDKRDAGKAKEAMFDYLMKIIIIGDSGVGKTNILLRYSEDRFVDNYLLTIGINYLFKVEDVDGVRIKIQIWDTAGQDKYKTITRSYYNGSHGVIVVYSVDCRLSFMAVKSWVADLREKVKPNCQLVLLANKIDILQQTRQVSTAQGLELAKSLEIPFFECSAKTGENIQKAFHRLAVSLKHNIIDKQTAPEGQQTPGKDDLHFLEDRSTNHSFKYSIATGQPKQKKACHC